jgi:hypothetical protein
MYLANGMPLAFTASGTVKTKYNVGNYSQRRRRTMFPLQLSTLIPVLIQKEVEFTALMQGLDIKVGDFLYESRDGLSSIANINDVTGAVEAYTPETYAIPISDANLDQIIISDIHSEELI